MIDRARNPADLPFDLSVAATDRRATPSSWALYQKEIERSRRLSEREEAELAIRAREGDERAQDELVRANLRLVVTICGPFARDTIPLADLVGAGNEGLLKAARCRKFDPAFGVPFHRYAAEWIRKYVKEYLAQQVYPHVPVSRAMRVHRAIRAQRQLTQRGGGPPSVQEVARRTGLSEDEVSEALQLGQPAVELDAPGPSDGEGSLAPAVYDALEARLQEVEERSPTELQDAVLAALERHLNERERVVAVLHFGLDGRRPLDDQQIGAWLGLTGERIRQIRIRIRERLQAAPELLACWM